MTEPRTAALAFLGCKVSQYETAALATGFRQAGLAVVPWGGPADIVVVNTCAVTARAASQSRQLVRRVARLQPAARLVVTGCHAQTAPDELAASVAAPLCLVGNSAKDRLVALALAEPWPAAGRHLAPMTDCRHVAQLPLPAMAGRTRAFLRVQDGCDNGCTYCIVPQARGPSRSLAPEAVLAQAQALAAAGYRELVITGIHAGAYGHDLAPPRSLAGLLRLLLAETRVPRLRVSSLEPSEITPELLALFSAQPRLMPHFHIPLQSGDNGVLARMHRPYRMEDYRAVVQAVHAALPEAAIGADVLVGFPGEDDAAFGRTAALVEALPLSSLHVFAYSPRPGTLAAAMADQVPPADKERRRQLLAGLDRDKRAAFAGRFLGQERPALIEGRPRRGIGLTGHTDNYLPVIVQGSSALVNALVRVRIGPPTAAGLLASVVAG
ncbi:MAG: tRNA (N(6)-L-threonylcarbamoyladenosine(37)-C(2))-methylthiotransferase MtaB [Thermodesulfobacteriota bacterium]